MLHPRHRPGSQCESLGLPWETSESPRISENASVPNIHFLLKNKLGHFQSQVTLYVVQILSGMVQRGKSPQSLLFRQCPKRAHQSETPAGACQRGKGMKLWGGLDDAPGRQPLLPPRGMLWVLTTGDMVPLLSQPTYLRRDHKASWKDTTE